MQSEHRPVVEPAVRRAGLALRAATAAYVLTCGVGLAVRRGLLRTDRARWVHHALFVTTAVTTALAVAALAAARDRAALVLAASAVPFVALTRVSARTGPHARVALAAAPAYAAAWLVADRGVVSARARAGAR
jgi:hypothetical protein